VRPLPAPDPLTLETEGVVIPFDPGVITPAIAEAIRSGRFEAEEASQLAAIVRPGDHVLEIGAGIGFISTLLARQPRVARVVAVEANPQLMGYMARLHGLNGVRKVRRVNAVLTNGPEHAATFYLRRDFWMGSLAPAPNPYVDTVEVPTLNLDALLREEQIDLVVCDVEGAEATLFEGADLSGVDRVWVETHDHVTGLSGVRRLFATMSAQGFVYDPRHSQGSVVLFRRLGEEDIVRPYEEQAEA
jgi:FkbM family methyltransferase